MKEDAHFSILWLSDLLPDREWLQLEEQFKVVSSGVPQPIAPTEDEVARVRYNLDISQLVSDAPQNENSATGGDLKKIVPV